MPVLAIEIHDAGIRVVEDSSPETDAMAPSPGYAVLDGDTLVTGTEAYRRARLMPRWSSNRFWDVLDTSRLPRPFPQRLTHADLAHSHLDGIWRSFARPDRRVLMVIPGWYRDRQLGLALGIARSCGMSVLGMVDSALAASAVGWDGVCAIHLDIHLHRAAATLVERDTEIRRGGIQGAPGLGLVSIWEAWVRLIARQFVRKTRFDPLHIARTEQALYMGLPSWLERLLDHESTLLVMEAGGKEYSIEIGRDELVECVRPLYEQLAGLVRSMLPVGRRATLLCSSRIAGLPGLQDLLSDGPCSDRIVLPPTAAATGTLQFKQWIASASDRTDELTFVTRLPLARNGSPVHAGTEERSTRSLPTHVLYEGNAMALSSEPFLLGSNAPETGRGLRLDGEGISPSHCRIHRLLDRVMVEDRSREGVFLNGRRIDGWGEVRVGDCLRVGDPGAEVRFIAVRAGHETA